METLTAEQGQKMSKLDGWNAAWAFFMILIFTPAFLLSTTVEGVSFHTALNLVGGQLMGWGFPHFMAVVMVWPVTILATLIPGSSTWLLGPLLMSMGSMPWLMVIVGGLFFFQFEMPYYRHLKDKIDPGCIEREESRIIIRAKMRPRPFAGLMVFLVVFGLSGEIIYGVWGRDAFADDFEGKVYLVNSKNQSFPLDATLRMSFIDPGRFVFDRKPGMYNQSIHLEFSSQSAQDIERLKRLGVSSRMFKGQTEEDERGYTSNMCEIKSAGVSKEYRAYTGKYMTGEASSFHYEIGKSYDSGDVDCPKNMHMLIGSFNHVQFAIDRVNPEWMIVADMERDSRFGWLQRQILKYRFGSNPQGVLDHHRNTRI